MKIFLSSLLGVSLSFYSCVYANDMQSNTDITDASKTILTSEDKSSFTVALPSNPSTGFVWLIESYDTQLLTLTQHDYTPPNTKNVVGATGVEHWTFHEKSKMLAPQVTKITLIHARPWDVANTSAETKTFKVVIE